MHSYSYCVLRYLHDPSVGESINVGVLVYAPEDKFVRFQSEHRTKAFSDLFRGFSRKEFIRFLFRLEASVERFQNTLSQSGGGLFQMDKVPENAEVLAKWLIADNNLNFQFGSVKGGVTRDLNKVTQTVFDRMIRLQRPSDGNERKRRDETVVWNSFQQAFKEHGINKVLSPHVIETPSFDLPFDYAFKNDRWHAIEPLSFDYARPEEIRIKANLWYSYGAALKESEDFAKLYLLLGAPENPEYMADYKRAKDWLKKMPGNHVIVEEDEAEEFAESLAKEMKEHNILLKDSEIEAE